MPPRKFGARASVMKGSTNFSTKFLSRNHYKGKGVPPEGRHTNMGGYELQRWRQPEIIIPDLTGFKLKPYVSKATPKLSTATLSAALNKP